MYFDPLYFVFALPGLLIALIAQIWLKAAYSSNSKKDAGSGMTGMQAAEFLNEKEGFGVSFNVESGYLNDHYDPRNNSVQVSSDNATNGSIANIAVVAHEFGHVQQKHSSSLLFGIRSALVPVVGFGSTIGYFLFVAGIIFSVAGLQDLGLILFSLTFIFALVTLPIELDASRRGMNLIKKYNLISEGNLGGAKTVLRAAALTYVAGLVQSLGQVLYFLMIRSRSRD